MGYAITPEHIARDPALSVGAKALWQVLATYASGSSNDQRVWPSQETIAQHLGCTDRTVRNLSAELQTAGYATVQNERTQRGLFSVYTLHMGDQKITVAESPPETGFRSGPERDRKQASAPDRKQASREGSQLEGSGRISLTERYGRQPSLLEEQPAKPTKKQTVAQNPPTMEQTRIIFAELGCSTNRMHVADNCFDYYLSAGWKRKGGSLMDWAATCRTWWRNEVARNGAGGMIRTPAGNKNLMPERRIDNDEIEF